MSRLGHWIALIRAMGHQELLFALLAAIFAALVLAAVAFAGVALVLRLRNVWVARRWKMVEERLMDLLLAVLEGDQPAEVLHRAVQGHERRTFVDLAAKVARRLRGPERARLAEAVRPFLPLVERRTRHRDAGVRAYAVQTLGLLDLDRHAQTLVDALDDRSELVAMTAARELAQRDHPQYAPMVLARLRRFTNWETTYLASRLAGIGPEAAVALEAALADEAQPPRARAISAEALRLLNSLPAAATAARILRTTTDRDLLASCLRLIRQVGQPQHIPAVRAQVSAADPVVRAAAIAALAALEAPAALAELAPNLDDPSPWVALETARALRQVDDGRLLEGLASGSPRRAALAAQVFAEVPA